MSAIRLSKRYAKAVLDLASQKGVVTEVLADVRRIKGDITGNRDLELLLKSPIVSADKKLNVLRAIYGERVHEILREFMEVLVRKRREGYLLSICNAFVELYNEKAHIKSVRITTAQPISEELQRKIADSMRTADTEDIDLTVEVDPEILGGYVVEFDDKAYDASVSRNLNAMRAEFTKNTYVKKY